jgi:hypothetical protein
MTDGPPSRHPSCLPSGDARVSTAIPDQVGDDQVTDLDLDWKALCFVCDDLLDGRFALCASNVSNIVRVRQVVLPTFWRALVMQEALIIWVMLWKHNTMGVGEE